MKAHTLTLAILICQISFAQITQEDISKLKDLPESYQYLLDVLKQKLNTERVFETTKHQRFELEIFEFKIASQKIYDTINNSYNENRKIAYQQYGVNSEQAFYDFDDQIIKTITFDYDNENQLLFETTLDESEEETIKITYDYSECKSNYIADLLDNSNSLYANRTFKCETITTVKKISNYTTSIVNVFKQGMGRVKKINLKGDKDSEVSRFYTYQYDGNGNVIKINLHRNDKIKVYKTFIYNQNGDVTRIKQGYVELYYTYKYDENNRWTEKIETSRVKGKRTIYKRTITY